MRRLFGPFLGLGCVLALMLACFGQVLFSGQQFGYRDSAHFYYPLYQRVEQEWNKGRIPLWDSRENAGMPLLGNPTAAVLYPGKLIYRALPYPWAARLYTISHIALAVMGMFLLMRQLGTHPSGALVSGISYAFGAPILFQYCNIIFLVGAAWVPFGLAASDVWLRTGRRWGILALGFVLAMQVMGGDPQSAYMTGLCAGGYGLGLAVARRRRLRKRAPMRAGSVWAIAVGGLLVWFAGVLLCAWVFPMTRPPRIEPPAVPLRWSPYASKAVLAVWAVGGAIWLMRRKPADRVLPTMMGGLVLAATLAGMLCAVQLLPVTEFTSRTVRASEDGPHDIYPFSLEWPRLGELVWPDLYGSTRTSYRSWAALIPPLHSSEVWVPSLYLGGLTIVLAITSFGSGGDRRRVWFSAIAVLGLAAALGEFGSPLWIARNLPAVAEILGPHDKIQTTSMRLDGKLRDGDGGLYSILANVLPGFGSFRYPSKLLTFACLGIAGLAGVGFDRIREGDRRLAIRVSFVLLALSVIGLSAMVVGRSEFLSALKSSPGSKGGSSFGPFDFDGAWIETRNALIHGSVVFLSVFLVLRGTKSKPRATIALALILLTADLIFANARMIITVPQSVFDEKPEILRRIEEEEKRDPSKGPYRVHRMPYWEPTGWAETASPTRYRELVEWERKTIQPKYAIPYKLEYTLAEGFAELYDYLWFFSPFQANRIHPDKPLDDKTNPRIVYHPRRGFDLWNTRYFVVPAVYFNDERRSFSSFLPNSEPIYPTKEILSGPGGKAFLAKWDKQEDWRILKNKQAFPRTWIVHKLDIRLPLTDLNRSDRVPLMMEMLYIGDPFWNEPERSVLDLANIAYVETEDRVSVQGFCSRADADSEETSQVITHDDMRVEILAKLKSNGLVILSDIAYPGWELTIDAAPATILRTNRLMRGALVGPGEHTLIYTYRPKSFRNGLVITCAGLAVFVVMCIAFWFRPVTRRLAA